jgi:hypothetical protein
MKAIGPDRVERLTDGSIRLVCPDAKGWCARTPKTLTSPEHPGTAVRWEGDLFEVLEASPQDVGDAIGYRLARWEARHTVRVITTYDEASESARRAEQRRRREDLRRHRASIALAPLLGHLPASVQQRMEREFGAPARALTIASALPLLVLGTLGLLAFLVGSFGGGGSVFAGWPILPLPLALFLFVESAVRLGVAFLQGDPMGSVAGTILYELWRRGSGLAGPRRPELNLAPQARDARKENR